MELVGVCVDLLRCCCCVRGLLSVSVCGVANLPFLTSFQSPVLGGQSSDIDASF